MKFIPKGSLRSYLNMPQRRLMDVSAFPVNEAGKRVKTYWEEVESGKHDGMATPEDDAIEFYCLNHLVSILGTKFDLDEPLPGWAQDIVGDYVIALADQGQRLYSYILLITTRESRHLHNPETALAKWPVHQKWHNSIKGAGSLGAANTFCSSVPAIPIGQYMEALMTQFDHGKYSGSFGGKPWGNIARCLHQMVTGKTTIEMMVDTAYTLAHNGGPMFNKGMLYEMYNGHMLLKILDIQRSGQIPEGVLTSTFKNYGKVWKDYVVKVKEEFPNSIGDYVDYHKVVALGAKGHYAAEVAAQKVYVPPVKATLGKKVLVPVAEFQVMPGVTVTQNKREAA